MVTDIHIGLAALAGIAVFAVVGAIAEFVATMYWEGRRDE